MKIVHIESGLGNQMLSYCEFLALKKSNPKDDIFIETSIYMIFLNVMIQFVSGMDMN